MRRWKVGKGQKVGVVGLGGLGAFFVKVLVANPRRLELISAQGLRAGEIVGLHMIGPDAPEILQAAAIAVKAKLKKADFDATIALHPTMAEELVLMR